MQTEIENGQRMRVMKKLNDTPLKVHLKKVMVAPILPHRKMVGLKIIIGLKN